MKAARIHSRILKRDSTLDRNTGELFQRSSAKIMAAKKVVTKSERIIYLRYSLQYTKLQHPFTNISLLSAFRFLFLLFQKLFPQLRLSFVIYFIESLVYLYANHMLSWDDYVARVLKCLP
ncbi:hypothetical protein FGO68_gene11924 [Halteria grandinella]|uniref:Uncharacterized protein n=1 Tax=Halteria grandinella TaxID=5974 RepID=A0A8J8SY33_HALGN|nr:hypothetical protein FGO68_gene11924 [Halteria grandinella]